MRKILITNKREAEQFLQSRGYSSQEIIDLKRTTNNKDLARMLKTSPNTVQVVLEFIGVDYSKAQWNKYDVTKAKISQTRERQKGSISDLTHEDLVKMAEDSNYDLKTMANELDVFQSVLVERLEELDVDLARLLSEKRNDVAQRKIQDWEEKQREEIRSKLASKVPVTVVKDQCRRSALKNGINAREARRFLQDYFSQELSDDQIVRLSPSEIALNSGLRKLKRNFANMKISKTLRSISLPETLLRSVFPDLIMGRTFRRYLHSIGDCSDPCLACRNLWDWTLEHKTLILSFLHLRTGSPLRLKLEERVRVFEYVRPSPEDNLADLVSKSSDPFAFVWWLLDDGLTMDSSERLSFHHYLDFYRGIKNSTLDDDVDKVLSGRKTSILTECPVDATGFENAWAYWKMEADPIVMEELLEKCRTTTINKILQLVPFFRRMTLFYSDSLSDFRNRILQIRKTEDVDEFKKYNPQEFSELIDFIDGRRTIDNVEVVSFCKTRSSLSFNRVIQTLGSLDVGIAKVDHSSVFEDNMERLLDGMGIHFLKNQRILRKNSVRGGKEIDFYMPDLNLGIEVSPTYTHNSTYGWNYDPTKGREPGYHQGKTLLAEEMGIDLLTFYERDLTEPNWFNITVPFIMFRLLGPSQVVYARETELKIVTSQTARAFLDTYHFQGFLPSKWHLGWFHRKTHELLGVASIDIFANARSKTIDGDSLELKRMCFLPDLMVPFGLSKLVGNLKEIIDDDLVAKAKSIYSYSRLDMGTGESYRKAGFSLVRTTPPSLRFVNPTDPHDSYSWSVATPWSAKSGFISKTVGSCEMSKDEAIDFMEKKMPRRSGNGIGYVRVYDSGSRLWSIEI